MKSKFFAMIAAAVLLLGMGACSPTAEYSLAILSQARAMR